MGKKRKDPESEDGEEEDFADQKPKKKQGKKIAKDAESKKSDSKKDKKSAPDDKKSPATKEAKPKSSQAHDFLPGQTKMTPPENDSAARFYQTLYDENPKSEMARKYMLEYGLLKKQEALKLINLIKKK